jgi:SAM-dependent methyltransferase
MKLNIGCGPYKQNGYINIDKNKVWEPDVVLDITNGLPYEDNTIDEIMAHHVIEHLDKNDVIKFIEQCYRKLKPNGVFDIIVPLGITYDLDHKSFFGVDSFKTILGEGSEGEKDKYYFGTKISFKLVSKNLSKNEHCEMINIIMMADKE